MGLRYRKSRNLGGGFRINISKAGIGYSWGIPGYRITRTASGKTRRTASIPGTGISYVTEDSGKSKITNKTAQEKDFLVTEIKNVDSGNIAELQPAEFTDLTNKLQRIITMNTISTCLIWGTIILCIGYQSIWRILLVLAAIILSLIHI